MELFATGLPSLESKTDKQIALSQNVQKLSEVQLQKPQQANCADTPFNSMLRSAFESGLTGGALLTGVGSNVIITFASGDFVVKRHVMSAAESLDIFKLGAFRGVAAGLATSSIDLGLRHYFGRNVLGHDLFRPTLIENVGIGVAVQLTDPRLRIGLAAGSWLLGRAQNYLFHQT